QLRQELTVARGARLEQADCVIPREHVGEEEAQQRLVAQLDRDLLAVEPADQRLASRVGQPVDAPAPLTPGGLLAGDESVLLEPPQLRIDLGVAGRPEVARGAVDDGLDVVPRARSERQESQDHPGRARGLHTARGYIAPIYLSRAWDGRGARRR